MLSLLDPRDLLASASFVAVLLTLLLPKLPLERLSKYRDYVVGVQAKLDEVLVAFDAIAEKLADGKLTSEEVLELKELVSALKPE